MHSDLLDEPPGRFRRQVAGRTLGRIQRRGKNIVIEAKSESGSVARLLVNLGMSGRLLHRTADTPSPAPTHLGVRFHLDNRSELIYHDPRRFGRLRLLDEGRYRAWSRSLGPEPLGSGFTAERLRDDLSRSSAPLRSWLLDQRKLAGIGNIYANEALFLAGLHPETPAREAVRGRVPRLHAALRTVLREAIQANGTTLRDYRTAQGWEGSYAGRLRVYGREGLPCPTCGSTIVRSVFGGRSAFHCPRCQPSPGGRSK
jgi:formamidopyrimidine-DNA glycosylase